MIGCDNVKIVAFFVFTWKDKLAHVVVGFAKFSFLQVFLWNENLSMFGTSLSFFLGYEFHFIVFITMMKKLPQFYFKKIDNDFNLILNFNFQSFFYQSSFWVWTLENILRKDVLSNGQWTLLLTESNITKIEAFIRRRWVCSDEYILHCWSMFTNNDILLVRWNFTVIEIVSIFNFHSIVMILLESYSFPWILFMNIWNVVKCLYLPFASFFLVSLAWKMHQNLVPSQNKCHR